MSHAVLYCCFSSPDKCAVSIDSFHATFLNLKYYTFSRLNRDTSPSHTDSTNVLAVPASQVQCVYTLCPDNGNFLPQQIGELEDSSETTTPVARKELDKVQLQEEDEDHEEKPSLESKLEEDRRRIEAEMQRMYELKLSEVRKYNCSTLNLELLAFANFRVFPNFCN